MRTNLSSDVDYWLDNYMVTNAVWCAVLSNGQNVIEHDERPGVYPRSTWERLKTHCLVNSLYVVQMKIKFRTNERCLEIGNEGVFFCKSILAGISGKNVFSYLTGRLDGRILKVVKWRVPDLEPESFLDDSMVSYRDPSKYEDCLIRKS